jgi:hypothetical protein
MPRQDSLTDQLLDLSELLQKYDMPDTAAWVRGHGAKPSKDDIRKAIKTANRHSMYDASDWLEARLTET